jgi:8-amino-7-oxononanoate synthase
MHEPSDLEQRLRADLIEWDRQGLRRRLSPPSGIDLCSNDYLCFSRHPVVRRAMAHAAKREGCGSTGSRLLRGERQQFQDLERCFATFTGAERALYFPSGYLANLAVLSTIPRLGDIVYSDARNHASLIDGIRLSGAQKRIFAHCDVAALADALRTECTPGQKFIITESLFSMDGDLAPLAAYDALCRETGAVLIVDEAHAVGIYGRRGSGLLEETGAAALVSISTAGKALGVSGAFVSGPDWAIEYLLQRARPFNFSTAAPPPVAAALKASLALAEAEPWRRQQLRERARYLRRRLGLAGESQIIPIVIGENERALRVADALQRQGFDVRAVRPPSVAPGTARLRVSVNVGLSADTLDRFAAAVTAALKEAECCMAFS